MTVDIEEALDPRFTDWRLRLQEVASTSELTVILSTVGRENGSDDTEIGRETISLPDMDALRQQISGFSNSDERTISLLGDILFPTQIRRILHQRFREANPPYLNLRLQADQTELNDLPWERASLTDVSGTVSPLALHPRIRFLRELRISKATPRADPRTDQNGRMDALVAGADPDSHLFPRLLQLSPEIATVTNLLESAPECRRSFRVTTLPDATPAILQRRLQELRPAVLHLIAHGMETASGPSLVLQGERPQTAAMTYIDEIAEWVRATPPRLVLIAACGTPHGARESAQEFLDAGVGAVIALQSPFREIIARQFSRAFYAAFGETGDATESLWEARQAISGAGPDWSDPVLYRAAGFSLATDSREKLVSAVELRETPNNVPSAARRFIGREPDVTILRERLIDKRERLVTVTGIGGMGKTTLTLHCARELTIADESDTVAFPDGVVVVELDTLNGAEEIAASLLLQVSTVLQVAQTGTASTSDAALDAAIKRIGRRQVLIVLDCFERHLAHVHLVDALIRRCPHVQVLVSSRILLGLPFESEYHLNPMPTPDVAPGEPTSSPSSPRKGTGAPILSDAVALFTETARQVRSDFQWEPSRETIEEICRVLEGIPLSLQLAAGRLRFLSPQELLAQIKERPLNILRRRTVGDISFDRHAALQDVIAGSFALLDLPVRSLLQQLGVFAGGFYLNDALTVCRLSDSEDILECLSSLRENSLVQCSERNGRTRYRLLDTVREYLTTLTGAETEQEQSSLDACRARHATQFALLVQEFARRRRAGDTASALGDTVIGEIANVRAAAQFLIAAEDYDRLIDLADCLARLLIEAGLWSDFDWLSDAAQTAHERMKQPAKFIRLLAFRALIARRRGDEAEARRLLERRCALCRQENDYAGLADSLFELGAQANESDDAARAGTLFEEVSAIGVTHGLPGAAANAYAAQAELALGRQETDAAEKHADAAQFLLTQGIPPDDALYTGLILGRVWRHLASSSRAESQLFTVLHTSLDSHRTFTVSKALLELGSLYEANGAFDAAARCFLTADRIHRKLDARRREQTMAALSRFRRLYGDRDDVQAAFRATRNRPWTDVTAQLLVRSQLPAQC